MPPPAHSPERTLPSPGRAPPAPPDPCSAHRPLMRDDAAAAEHVTLTMRRRLVWSNPGQILRIEIGTSSRVGIIRENDDCENGIERGCRMAKNWQQAGGTKDGGWSGADGWAAEPRERTGWCSTRASVRQAGAARAPVRACMPAACTQCPCRQGDAFCGQLRSVLQRKTGPAAQEQAVDGSGGTTRPGVRAGLIRASSGGPCPR